jgi:glucose-6-phosphate 1-epimerase
MHERANVEALNFRFGIPGLAEVVAGEGGLAKVRVSTHLAAGEIYLHGAQVTAWKPEGLMDVLFLSGHSRWEDGRAIRGGIPICFPWFRAKADDVQAPAHGVVRTREWRLDAIAAEEDGAAVVICSTESDEATRRWWPHEFHLTHRITVGKTLRLELIAKNTGASPFQFEEALHTYFRVGAVAGACVRGLDGSSYLDNMDGNREKAQQGDVVFAGPLDNAYLHAEGALELVDAVLHRTLRTDKENSATTVVWNPWEKAAAALADLGDEEWKDFACVEASNIVGGAVTLEPGEEHVLRATVSVLRV